MLVGRETQRGLSVLPKKTVPWLMSPTLVIQGVVYCTLIIQFGVFFLASCPGNEKSHYKEHHPGKCDTVGVSKCYFCVSACWHAAV